MNISIRVLVVDDSEDDTLLLIDELIDNGCNPTYIRVDTPEAMKTALLEKPWDVIIADYRMPQFSGPDALKVLQDIGLDIPLILVSGTAEEHTGVDMMRAGAQDFILKHNLCRLAPAITREIGEAESRRQRKRAEASAKAAAENYRMLFQYSPVAVVVYDREAIILQVNPAFEQLFGFSVEEVVGKHLWETFGLPKNAEKTRSVAAQIFNGEIVRNVEYEDVRKDGKAVYVLTNITPVCNEYGKVIMALAMITDITEHKEVETHKRDFYRRTILAATDGKLLVCEAEEIEDVAGSPIGSWPVSNKEDLNVMRDDVHRIAREQGMDESRVPDLLGCVVEAASNAIKHADGGHASLHRKGDSLIFMISDSGPGIVALALPDVALVKGYSTAGTLGMGYKIMIEYSDRVYLATGPEGTTVATEMRLHAGLSKGDAFLQNLSEKLSEEMPDVE